MRLVMTLLVRDEEDVIGANLEFHLAQGVDHFIITDNKSVDGTAAIIRPYIDKGLVTYLYEPRDDYSQGEWVTNMARSAAIEHHADWVINSDADEFWMPTDETASLKSTLGSSSPTTAAIVVPRFNCPPMDRDGVGSFATRMIFRERQSVNALGEPLRPKVCHRGSGDIAVGQGNHSVYRNGMKLPAVPAALHILHYPLRSYSQFESKIVKGGAAMARNTRLPPDAGHAWRNLYRLWHEQGSLLEQYLREIPSEEDLQERLLTGHLIRDERVARTLHEAASRQCGSDG